MPRGGKRAGAGRPPKVGKANGAGPAGVRTASVKGRARKAGRGKQSKQSKPAPLKTSDRIPQVSEKQAKYVAGLAELKTKKQAALDAGYSESVARAASASIEGPGVRELFQTIARCWIDPELLGKRIAEGLNANETKFFQYAGVVTEQIDVVSWSERRQYAELAARFAGYHVDKQEVEVKHGLSPEIASKELDELLASIAARADKQSKSGRASKAN